ncbi:dihydrofolate reductase [Poronia punctata]|nr:dihydrofolate reductase [Poronia punctata]
MPPPSPELTLIVAATRTMGIGKNGTLPWTGLKQEMAYFARVTKRSNNHLNAVIMGRKTWESIPPRFRPLKDRLNIIISRSHTLPPTSSSTPQEEEEESVSSNIVKVSSLEQALTHVKNTNTTNKKIEKIFVIGGAQIYEAALEMKETKRILLTRIMTDFECDTFFPLQLGTEEGKEKGQGQGQGEWVRKTKKELDEWTGEMVPEGLQVENGTGYEFQMWEREVIE